MPDDILPEEAHATDESVARYAAYAVRLKTIALSLKRYVAYSSDFGEAFRPLAHPNVVRASYAVAWTYITYDVTSEGMGSYERGESREKIAEVVTKRVVFQTLASMLLPAITIHSTVKYASLAFRRLGRFQRWGPTLSGLAVMPALPFMFDHPTEYVVDKVFDSAFEQWRKRAALEDKKDL